MFDFISNMGPGMKGFLGGAVAIGFPLLFNLWKDFHFDKRKREAERAFISVQLVFLLDKFVALCAEVAWDEGYDPTLPPPNDDQLEDQTKIPTFDMSSVKGEHKYLEADMLARLHFIEIKLHQAKETLSEPFADWDFDGYQWMYYERRRELLAEIGLYAAAIAEDLRKAFKIKSIADWQPANRIRKSMLHLEAERRRREESRRKRKAEQESKATSNKETDTD